MADEDKEVELPKEEEEKPAPPIEGEETKDEKKDEDEEPKTRVPQKKEDNRLGYELRQREKRIKELEEENERLKEAPSETGDDTDTKKYLTREEFDERLSAIEFNKRTESDIQETLTKNPSYKRFEKTLRKYANNESYRNVPVDFIASALNEKFGQAEKETDEHKASGNTRRAMPGKKKIWDMSKEEFNDYQQEQLNRARD